MRQSADEQKTQVSGLMSDSILFYSIDILRAKRKIKNKKKERERERFYKIQTGNDGRRRGMTCNSGPWDIGVICYKS